MPPENNNQIQTEKKSSILTNVLLILLIALVGYGLWVMSFKSDKNIPQIDTNDQSNQVDLNDSNNQDEEQQNNPSVNLYKNHGIVFELPAGFVPREEDSEGGPYTTIILPNGNGVLTYIKDFSWWQKYDASVYTYIGTEKIGNNTFTIYKFNDSAYTYADSRYYMFNQGNVAYMFSINEPNKILLETFQFVGWN